jgi:hypothetical protein
MFAGTYPAHEMQPIFGFLTGQLRPHAGSIFGSRNFYCVFLSPIYDKEWQP